MKVRKQRCPTCKMEIAGDENADGSGESPSAGDIGVCLHCATMLVFVERDGMLERTLATQEQYDELAGSRSMRSIERAVHFVQRRRGVGTRING